MLPYLKNPSLDDQKLIKSYSKEDRGLFFFFRHMCIKMQSHFLSLVNAKTIPRVFLHGNPHVENFSITEYGSAMSDFDRSRIGPYAWDISRFLASLSLKRAEQDSPFLSSSVLEYFKEGYVRGFEVHYLPFKEISQTLARGNFAIWYESTDDYLKDEGKWWAEMQKLPLKKDDKKMLKLLNGYLKSREEEGLMETYSIKNAGLAKGTFGNQRTVVLLEPREDKSLDKLLLEIKEVYEDRDNDSFHNPYDHHGKRMIEASNLYAPGIEQRLGYTTLDGQQYWGREIITRHGKLKQSLDEFDQVDIAYSVGSQLGRAHRLSLQEDIKPRKFIMHLLENYEYFIGVSVQMNTDLMAAYRYYMDHLEAK